MIQIKDTIVSLDLIEEFFTCDLDSCLGECCIEGDAGAPLSAAEAGRLEEYRDQIRPLLTPAARRVLDEQGPCYVDVEGDLVTSIVGDRDCIFTTYAPGGKCLCALEAASRRGELPQLKPMSCHLYPARLKQYAGFTAVNYHRWKICRSAVACGRSRGVRVYEFLKEPLVRRFGQEWWDELDFTAREYLRQTGK